MHLRSLYICNYVSDLVAAKIWYAIYIINHHVIVVYC